MSGALLFHEILMIWAFGAVVGAGLVLIMGRYQ